MDAKIKGSYYWVKFYNHNREQLMLFNGTNFEGFKSDEFAHDEIESYELVKRANQSKQVPCSTEKTKAINNHIDSCKYGTTTNGASFRDAIMWYEEYLKSLSNPEAEKKLTAYQVWKKVKKENLSKAEYKQLLIDNDILIPSTPEEKETKQLMDCSGEVLNCYYCGSIDINHSNEIIQSNHWIHCNKCAKSYMIDKEVEDEAINWLKTNYPNLQLYPIEAEEFVEMLNKYKYESEQPAPQDKKEGDTK